ncbi:MAG: serine/threonine-protein kinase [Acidimicrobiales bacterium]
MRTPPSTGLLADRYQLREMLGRGGMAEVYDGWDERLQRPVAVKLLRPEMAARPEVRSRFEVEGRTAAQLSHPNVVAVYDTGIHDRAPFLVMERLPGRTLADRLVDGPLSTADARRLARDVLGALGAAHAAGIVHRDVKPANILLAPDGSAKVADFGIAKSGDLAAGDPTTAGALLGTPAYLAPERVDGRPATPRSDLYALGVVLYEALAGAKPFQAPTPLAMAAAIQTGTPPPLATVGPHADRGLLAAVDAAMARDPDDRPASAAAMTALLEPTTGPPGAGPTVVDPTVVGPTVVDPTMVLAAVPAVPVPVPRPRRRMWTLAAVAAALVSLLAAASLGDRGGQTADGHATLVAALGELAGRVETGDGPRGPEAATRLRSTAEAAAAADGVAEATTLALDALAWHAVGDLSTAAATEMVALLGRMPGVGPLPAVSAPSQPPPTAAAPTSQVPGDQDDGEGRGGRRGRPAKRAKRGDDDD